MAQISDLHKDCENSKGSARIQALAGSIGPLRSKSKSVLILLAGDIAYSRQAAEYSVALKELGELKIRLIDEWYF